MCWGYSWLANIVKRYTFEWFTISSTYFYAHILTIGDGAAALNCNIIVGVEICLESINSFNFAMPGAEEAC